MRLTIVVMGFLFCTSTLFSMQQITQEDSTIVPIVGIQDVIVNSSLYIVSRLSSDKKERKTYRVDFQAIYLSRCLSTYFVSCENAYDMSIVELRRSEKAPLAVDFSDEHICFFVTLLNTMQQEDLSCEKIVLWLRILTDDYQTISLSEVIRIVQFFNVPRIMQALRTIDPLLI